ncbi:MAG: class IV adenylate cyclase [Bacteroidales bacterium]|nr:class IV adenylate cyclase [Bacteroidales bacterium]MCF8405112.1 class IV adenylate cyclase [Bacteroidales bacterium]
MDFICNMGFINVEIKARCTDAHKIATILHEHNAVFKGVDHQVDTYFYVPDGRLKLREGNIENALIHYNRNNDAGPKTSEVSLYKSNPGSTLKELLVKSLGVLVVVDKKRKIYFIENVKFHLDEVEGLGGFVEIEAIDAEGVLGKEKLEEQCNAYIRMLGIKEHDLVKLSYSDMLLDKNNG